MTLIHNFRINTMFNLQIERSDISPGLKRIAVDKWLADMSGSAGTQFKKKKIQSAIDTGELSIEKAFQEVLGPIVEQEIRNAVKTERQLLTREILQRQFP